MIGFLRRSIENRFIYFPPKHPYGFPPLSSFGTQCENVWLRTRDGVNLNSCYFSCSTSHKVLLWFHGNAEDISTSFRQFEFYARLGTNLLVLDYRGYGKSEGSPSEEGLYLDADAAYRYLIEDRHLQPAEIVLFGHSLGGVVAIDLASRCECGGLIVESSLTSAREMARRVLGFPLLGYRPKTQFDSLSKVANVRAPKLIVHGTEDQVIPFFMGERLFENAAEPKFFYSVPAAGHNDVLQVGAESYLKRLREFIDSLPGQSSTDMARSLGQG